MRRISLGLRAVLCLVAGAWSLSLVSPGLVAQASDKLIGVEQPATSGTSQPSSATAKPKPTDPPEKPPKKPKDEPVARAAAATSGAAGADAGVSLASSLSSSMDAFTGTMRTGLTILVPPGRNGVQPSLQLTYRSGEGVGWVGAGWRLEMGSIERQTRFGVDYSKDDYILRLSGAVIDLVKTPGLGATDYRAKIESGFLRIRKLSSDGLSGWEVTDPKGMKYLLGTTAGSRATDPGDASRIFRWHLDRIEDTSGNYLTVSYASDQGERYLDQIDYTGNSGASPTNQIKFWRESVPSGWPIPETYAGDYRLRTASRLQTIEVRANGSLQRAYALTYSRTLSTSPSLLTTVKLYGKDATLDGTGTVTGGSALPAVTFAYDEGAASVQQIVSSGGHVVGGATRYADITGDGRAEFIAVSSDGCHRITFYNSDSTIQSNTTTCGVHGVGNAPFFIDFDDDGRAEYLTMDSAGCHGKTYYNTDGSLNHNVSSCGGHGVGSLPAFADIDNDGRVEYLTMDNSGCHHKTFYKADGTIDHNVTSCGGNGVGHSPHYADITGDGRVEYITVMNDGCHHMTFYNADGTIARTNSSCNGHGVGTANAFVDINGDGRADYVTVDTAGCHGVSFYNNLGGIIRTNVACGGHGVAGAPQWADINGDGRAEYITIENNGCHDITFYHPDGNILGNASLCGGNGWGSGPSLVQDANGDTRGEYLTSDSSGNHARTLYDYKGSLLTQMQNGIGGETTIASVPSTQFPFTVMPFPLLVVSSLATSDGNGNSATTTYSYTGGFYRVTERDFRGFHITTETGPTGPNGEQTSSETKFHQGNDVIPDVNNPKVPDGYMKGKPYRTKTTDASGNVLAESTTAYAADADSAAPWFAPSQQALAWTCAGTGSSCANAKQTRTDLTYNHTYGNVEREDQYGDTGISTDDRTVVRSFSPNATDWIVSLPATETIYEGIGTTNQKAQTTFYYDGTTSCGTASTNQTPTKGLLTRVVRWLSGGTNPETRMAYDATYGVPTCVRDPRGNITTTAYDSTFTFPLTVTNALSHVTTTVYYGVNGVAMDQGLFGQVKSVTDPNGRTASSTYDAFGRPSSSTAPNGLVTTTTYNSLGTVGSQHVLTSRTVSGVTFQSWTYFDGLGRTIKAKSTGPQTPSAQNVVTQTLYNVRGQVSQSSLPFFEGGTPLWRTMTYDALGRVKTVTTPDGKVTATCYDPWVTVVINPKSQKKRQVADAYGRTITVQEYTGSYDPAQCSASVGSPYAATSYAYDVLGNLTTVTDALGNQTTMTYDTVSRKTAMHDPDMGNWSYVYDAAGNLIQQTDAKAQNLYFQYDELNRRRQKDYGTQKALGSGDVVYTYDGAAANNLVGRLAQVADSTGTVTFQYDVLGQVSSSTRTLFTTPYTFTYTRDTLSRLSTVTYPDNSVITYTYNGPFADQVKEGSTVYAQYNNYNALGQPVSIAYSNGVTTYFTYETNTFRLKSLQTTKSSTTMQNLEYAYDNVGNVQSLTDYLTAANSQTFTYDDLNRLLTGSSTAYGTITYAYNQIGNMASNSQVGTYSYPTSGASSVRPHAVSTAGSNSYTYDNNGNMSTGAGRTFNSYDFENRPTSITISGTTTTFTYDGDGGRVKKQTGSTVTWYISKLYECDGTACTKMIFSGAQRIVAKPVGQSSLYFYHGDHLGSTSVVTDSTGTQVQALTYYPFGQTRTNVPGSPVDVAHKYTGKELDNATGLYFYESRYYDPVLGRFIQPDSIIPSARDPQSLNRYTYALNNPLNRVDPSGHKSFFKSRFFKQLVGVVEFGVGVGIVALSPKCGPAAKACGAVGVSLMGDGARRINGDDSQPEGSVGIQCNTDGVCNPFVSNEASPSFGPGQRIGLIGPDLVNLKTLQQGLPLEGGFNPDYRSVRIFVGGILNDLDAQRANAERLNADLRVNNSTGGIFVDLFEALYLKATRGEANESVRTLRDLTILLTDPVHRKLIDIVVHSEGAIVASDALFLARDRGADLSQVSVTVYGGASWTFPKEVNVRIMSNPYDPVPGLLGRGDPVRGLLGASFLFGFTRHQLSDYAP